jgi:uncharacterized membrane protein
MLSNQILDWRILGFDLYHIVSWFWIYSFFGWIWESSFVSIKNRKLVNRGFVSGPVLTIYGCGAVAVYLLMKPFDSNIFVLYFGGVVVTTVLEYITGVLMEVIFHANWWDYSNQKFNFQGKICLSSSIGWGFFTLVLFYVFQPFVDWLVGLYPRKYGEVGISFITMIYCVDFGMSSFVAFHIKDKLRSLDKTWDEFVEYLQNSRLAEAAESLKERASVLKQESSGERIRTYLEERKSAFGEYLDRISGENTDRRETFQERKEEYLEKFDHFVETYLKDKMSMDWITKRYMKAYPHLNLSSKIKEARKGKKKEDIEGKEKDYH